MPVLVLGHSRPDTTARVIESLRVVCPEKVYLAVDGPRPVVKGEAARVRSVQEMMLGGIDWPCQVETVFREENLGIREGVADAITWFFENETEGIILEDDCLPNTSFFTFSDAMLDRYRDEPKVMDIGGYCLLDNVASPYSYFFSKYPQVWGWATWADRWRAFSLDESRFTELLDNLPSILADHEQERYWQGVLRKALNGSISSWAYFWTMTIWEGNGLAIQPNVSLIRNVGFTAEATHTKWWKDYRGFGRRETEELTALNYPPEVFWERDLDRKVFDVTYRKPPIPLRVVGAARELLRRRQSGDP